GLHPGRRARGRLRAHRVLPPRTGGEPQGRGAGQAAAQEAHLNLIHRARWAKGRSWLFTEQGGPRQKLVIPKRRASHGRVASSSSCTTDEYGRPVACSSAISQVRLADTQASNDREESSAASSAVAAAASSG